jgi:hypothetical protein
VSAVPARLRRQVATVEAMLGWTVDAIPGDPPLLRLGHDTPSGRETITVRPDGVLWTAVLHLCRRRALGLPARFVPARRPEPGDRQ